MSGAPVCGSCGARVFWVVKRDGGRMPLDPQATTAGNVWLDTSSDRAVVLNAAQRARAVEKGERLFMAHHATCPSRERHRVSRAQTVLDLGCEVWLGGAVRHGQRNRVGAPLR